MYKQISKFVSKSIWEVGYTKQHKKFIETKYKHNLLRIYGEDKKYSFQVIIKEIGVKWYEYKKPIFISNKGLEEIKELAYIVLKGTISEDTKEVELLRNIYKNIKWHKSLTKQSSQ
jgi:NADH:ubiquinone oxidoreductase subunit C